MICCSQCVFFVVVVVFHSQYISDPFFAFLLFDWYLSYLSYCGLSQQLRIRHTVLDIHRSLTFSLSLAQSFTCSDSFARLTIRLFIRCACSTRTTNVLPISLFWFRQFYILYIEIHSYRRLPFKLFRIYFNWSRMLCCYVIFFSIRLSAMCVSRVYYFDQNDFSYRDFRLLLLIFFFLFHFSSIGFYERINESLPFDTQIRYKVIRNKQTTSNQTKII